MLKLLLEDSRGHDHVSVPPVMSNLKLNDLPSFMANVDAYLALVKIVLEQFSNVTRANWLLFNTFDELEVEVSCTPFKSPQMKDRQVDDHLPMGYKAYYMQMNEIAIGLKRMKSNFLWVVRKFEEKKLPRNFMQDVESLDKGMVVKWCNQLQVLSHGSVGCFMTHCGWNSTMGGVSLGVPMVVMPQWTDQPTNAAFIEEVRKVGHRVRVNEKGIVTGKEIESCVNTRSWEERGGKSSKKIR